MKETKAVYVTKRDLSDQHYQFYNKAICVNPVHQIPSSAIRNCRAYTTKTDFQNVGCQYDSKKENFTGNYGNISTSRRRFDSGGNPRHEYFHASKSYTDIGVGSIKTLQRRKVRRIYLPETDDRGVGSSDLSSFINRRTRPWKEDSYYDHKKTSSKCVGGVLEDKIRSALSEKLSPIVHRKSGTTSPGIPFKENKNVEIGSNTIEKKLVTTTTQVENESISKDPVKHNEIQPNSEIKDVKQFKPKNKLFKTPADRTVKTDERSKNKDKKFKNPCKVFSSDSLVERVHDLEVPSDNKQSVELMENKLEREYRRMFSIKSKEKSSSEEPPSDFKKDSSIKRRFDALRRGLTKKDNQRSRVIVNKGSSQKSITSRRDVSINSDPPSLEARSYSNTKVYSPIQYFEQAPAGTSKYAYVKSSHLKKDLNSSHWSRLEDDSECQGVKGMFKLWGKKFNLEEDYCKKRATPFSSFELPKKAQEPKDRKNDEDKKDGKKYFFFKKKHKNKDKAGFKPKKGVTAGRCEVKDGLVIKMCASNYQSKAEVKDYDETFSKTWVDKYLTSDFDSRKSVRVRWNNKTYATSSSTVFELMDYFYRENGVVFKSRSDIITPESSFYKSYTQQINFVQQEIEAWMIPKMIIDNKNITNLLCKDEKNKQIRISEQNWLIDKSKAFAHKFEVVLRSENVMKVNDDNSAAYLRIDIPNGFFVDSSSGEDRKTQSSDEQVYKIVEYETESDLRKQKEVGLETEDYDENDFCFVVSVKDSKNLESKILETVIKSPPKHRDAVIQGSDVYIPKRCDVIGVGIITQRELSNAWKPILKIQDGPDTSDDESDPVMEPKIKKCEFAESYLQDYYRHWIPLGIDFFNWCISDSHLKGSNENSKTSFNNQGDGSKSCPNIYDDFQTSTSNEPCIPCGPCHPLPSMSEDKINRQETKAKSGFFNKRKKDKAKDDDLNRVLHKDSLEVFKKRKIYACSNKSKWGVGFECPEHGAISVPSIRDKEAQDTLTDCSPPKKSCCKIPPAPSARSKSCKKHVSLPDCDTMNEALAKQLARKHEGILTFKGAAGCNTCKKDSNAKRASVTSTVSARKGPDCINDCKNEKHPPCEDLPERCSPTKILLRKRSPSNFDTSKCCISPSESQQSLERHVKRHSPARSVPVSPNAQQSPRLKSLRPPISPRIPPCLTPKIPHTSGKPCSDKNSQHSQTCPDKLIIKIISSNGESHKPPTNCKPSPICPHFPPCIKTQSTQKSPTASESLSPEPPRQKAATVPNTPKKKKKIPEPKKCFTEPCSKIPSPNESDKFPWPVKNQEESDDKLKSPNQCDKKCDLIPPPPPLITPIDDKEKDCKPECANRQKTENIPQNPVESKPTSQPNINSSKGRITGLYLKMKPAKKKTCSEECIAWKAPKELIGDPNIIRLNSNEEINLKMKGTSPSTEEIRENQNIKVKDDDGNTLYERIDYKNDCSKPSCAILGDMYKASINRVSTPININNIACGVNKDDFEQKSDASVFNLIEIQFKLKVTKGERTTEVNIGNDEVNDGDEPDKNSQIYLAAHNLYDTNGDNHKSHQNNSKNDVSIRILIKNYKPKVGRDDKEYNDDFSENIASKFQTVSTAYSDESPGHVAENAFSIHRTTVDLTASTDKTEINVTNSNKYLSPQLTDAEPINLLKSSQSICHQYQEENKTDNDNDQNTSDISLEKKAIRVEFRKEIDRLVDENIDYDEFIESNNSIEYITKPRTRKEKKEMLKKVFEIANESDAKSKENKKELQDMLKFVLTSDSSANEAMVITSNELATDMTYASLKPKILRNTDSMNNYYHIESPLASYNSKVRMYPTEENSDSLKSESENEEQTCMCSKFAARLKLIGGGCCCRSVPNKKDEETNCDLRSEEDFCLLNYKEYVDIETQHSKLTASKINSAKISMHGVSLSKFNTTEPVIAQVKTSNRFNEEITNIIFKKSFTRKFVNHCPIKKFNRNTILGISDEDKIVIFDSKGKTPESNNKIEAKNTEKKDENDKNILKTFKFQQAADILQSYETKKAVLEIYAEKTLKDKGKGIVAKLPKFVYKNESDIKKFEKVVEKYNDVKRHVFIMSIQS